MKAFAIALFVPAVLAAQDGITLQATAPDLKRWHEQQIALGTRNDVTWPKRRNDTEKAVVALQRLESSLFMGLAEINNTWDSDGTASRTIRLAGEERRPRVEAEEVSAMHLDSMRRAAEPAQILTALKIRRAAVVRYAEDADSVAARFKELVRDAERGEAHYRREDRPQLSPAQRQVVKDLIAHYARTVRLTRGTVDFESKRSAALKAEGAALDKEIAAATSVMP